MRRLFSIIVLFAALALLASAGMSTSVVSIDGKNYYVHTVEAGQTVYSLSKLYGVSVADITSANPQAIEGVKAGQVIKILQVHNEKPLPRRKQERLFEQHIVNQGETAYSICKRYGITIQTLVEDNPGLDPTALGIGQVLMIRKGSMNTPQEAIDTTWKQYNAALNSVSTDYVYHSVEKGETFYSLTKLYGVSEEDIRRSNDLSEGLKAGQMLKIPVKGGGAALSGHGGVPVNGAGAGAPAGGVPAANGSAPANGGGGNGAPTNGAEGSAGAAPGNGAPSGQENAAGETPQTAERDTLRRHRNANRLNIALLLPLKGGTGDATGTFMDFYKGSLIALEDLKAKGVSVDVRVCNDTRSAAEVRNCLERPEMQDVDLIIGPVYESEMGPVLDFARGRQIPIVSPLAPVDSYQSNLIYQMSPSVATKYDKLRAVLQGDDKNVIVVRTSPVDAELEKGIRPLLPAQHATVDYSRKMSSAVFEKYLAPSKENVVVVLAQDQIEVDEILARLSSLQTNRVARGMSDSGITVVGASRWQRFSAVDRNLFFKLRLNFVSLYYADRSDKRVADFDRRYVAAFGTLPSLYSYRGYDAVKLFAGRVLGGVIGGGDLAAAVNGQDAGLLQMPYNFVQPSPNATHVNDAWGLVQYHDDYTITVK